MDYEQSTKLGGLVEIFQKMGMVFLILCIALAIQYDRVGSIGRGFLVPFGIASVASVIIGFLFWRRPRSCRLFIFLLFSVTLCFALIFTFFALTAEYLSFDYRSLYAKFFPVGCIIAFCSASHLFYMEFRYKKFTTSFLNLKTQFIANNLAYSPNISKDEKVSQVLIGILTGIFVLAAFASFGVNLEGVLFITFILSWLIAPVFLARNAHLFFSHLRNKVRS